MRICPHEQRFAMANSGQIMIAMIRWTWAGPKANPQSTWSKPNSPWRNLPKGWGSPTLVHSTSGRKDGWLGFRRRSISPGSRERTIWNSCRMDHCTGRGQLQIFWRLSRLGCLQTMLIMRNAFGNSRFRSFWGNMQMKFGRQGNRTGNAISDRRPIWDSTHANKPVVTSQSSQVQLSW